MNGKTDKQIAEECGMNYLRLNGAREVTHEVAKALIIAESSNGEEIPQHLADWFAGVPDELLPTIHRAYEQMFPSVKAAEYYKKYAEATGNVSYEDEELRTYLRVFTDGRRWWMSSQLERSLPEELSLFVRLYMGKGCMN